MKRYSEILVPDDGNSQTTAVLQVQGCAVYTFAACGLSSQIQMQTYLLALHHLTSHHQRTGLYIPCSTHFF